MAEMKIKKLMPMDPESRRLIDWMEKGVYDALQKKYLRTLLFCVCEAVDGPMIEEYSFSFTYSNTEGEEVSMNVSRVGHKKHGATFKSTPTEVTPNQMRSSACKMVRTLVQLMRTLDRMPEERTILMKLLYYDDVTHRVSFWHHRNVHPSDYEPPFFRCCADNEASNIWMKNPLKMEVGNVNSKHMILALKVKSILDPCEDENEDLQEDEQVSLGADSLQQDGSSSSDSEHSQEEQYIMAPKVKQPPAENNGTMSEDDTQDADQEQEKCARVREWICSWHMKTVELTDILSNFPEISVALTEEIIDKLLKEGLLLKSGRDVYTINKGKESFPDVGVVKEEVDVPDTQHVEKSHNNSNEDYMYMKALYHALPMEYVSVPKLQSKLKGEANQTTIRKFIDKMTEDGFVDNKVNRRLGKRVIHSDQTNKKLLEVKKAIDIKTKEPEVNAQPFEFDGVVDVSSNGRLSTCGGLHSIGSDLTRTCGVNEAQQYGSARSDQSSLAKMRDQRNTPTSKAQPISSLESGVGMLGNEQKEGVSKRVPHADDANATVCSRHTQEKRKSSLVEDPIMQFAKRQKPQAV
ncbi:hypothetical protein QJS10_CPB13g00205 [Acorus calamus]|uniref:HORMA domain-containing protein n=1 Tax=Acorus calamus TaxID=4465 RepID=A0AAV9DLU1_ACOCL|nr:hypothetical protein QJS10_CPB13g00205 [Acorus calamus]